MSETSALLDFTEAAAQKVQSLIDEENDASLVLRVYITGGGCSGFQYGFTFEQGNQGDDFVVTKTVTTPASQEKEVRLLVDPMSAQYLRGATIDYCDDVSGARFVIRNPNAKTTCSCGSSFSAQ